MKHIKLISKMISIEKNTHGLYNVVYLSLFNHKYYIDLFLGRFKMLVPFTGCDVRHEKELRKN